MGDLISRSALLKQFKWNCEGRCQTCVHTTLVGKEELCSLIVDAPAVDALPKSYCEQIRWERDIALEQLGEIGCQLGQKMDDIKKKIEDAPAVEQRWIPCSERLPDMSTGGVASEDVLMVLEWWDGEMSYDIGWYNKNGEWNVDGVHRKVIAWMPLPEPYKGE